MTTIALYETDVQNDFSLRTGALFVHGFEEPSSWKSYGAEARLPIIRTMHEWAKERGHLILGSVDRHFYEDAELIRNTGGAFDDHCMNGMEGQLRVDGLERQMDVYIRAKNGPHLGARVYQENEIREIVRAAQENGVHIMFEKQSYDVATNPNFEPFMKQMIDSGVSTIVINGFATDYCVKAAAIALADTAQRNGRIVGTDFRILVVTDAVTPVNIDFAGNKDMDFGKKALAELVQHGVELITSEQILSGAVDVNVSGGA